MEHGADKERKGKQSNTELWDGKGLSGHEEKEHGKNENSKDNRTHCSGLDVKLLGFHLERMLSC